MEKPYSHPDSRPSEARAPHKAAAFCSALAVLWAAPAAQGAEHSRLWGRQGELWSPASRLPDFSHAGYGRGEKPLPDVPRAASVKDFGAKGDGQADDTQAFLKALATVERGAIEVPPGRYRITGILEITRPNLVLRGAGPDKAVLVFPKPLNDIKPDWGATTDARRTSNYSWSGGFVWLRGSYGEKTLATVGGAAKRGDHAVTVSSASPLRVGQSVLLRVSDTPDNSLARHLYSDDPGPIDNLKGSTKASLACRITAVEGERIVFDRPLPFDIRPEWKPEVRRFEPTVTESGVENLCFEFPATDYQGHFTELGNNPVALSGVAHCWVRDIRIVNPDSGPMVSGHFNTVQGVVYESARKPDRGGNRGHHGIYLGGGDNLFTDFDIRFRFIHDVSVSHSAGNVVARGRGVDLCLDHHRRAPYENLFTDLDAGAGTRLWSSGGGSALGKHCAARGTFWNIRAARPLAYPPPGFGPPSMNLVGLRTDQPTVTEPDGKWFEAIAPASLVPQNLREAQLARRLGAGAAAGGKGSARAGEWKLAWSDEFDRPGLPDAAKWDYETGFVRNQEMQYYTRARKENARVENGMLVIEGRKERLKNPGYKPGSQNWKESREFAQYTAASLVTRNKAHFRYGRIEVRAKLPRGKGVWPAIWTLGADKAQVGWPGCGEIDIMEFVGHDPDRVHANAHFAVDGKHRSDAGKLTTKAPYEDFHIYAMEWYPDRIDFFFDQTRYHTFLLDKAGQGEDNPFRKPQFLLINLALGGSWGKEIDDSILPQRYLIDYVRVYDKGDQS